MPDLSLETSAARVVKRINVESEPQFATGADRVVARLKRQEQNVSDDDFALTYVGNISGQKDLSGPTPSAAMRAWLGFMGDTEEEKQSAYRLIHEQGELFTIPSTDITVYRQNPDQPFRKVDLGFWEGLNKGAGVEILRDIADFSGDAAEMLGEVYFGRRIPKGAGLLKSSGRLAVGAVMGTAAQETTQVAAGTQRESMSQVRQRMMMEGAFSITGSSVGYTVGAGIEAARGARGIFGVHPMAPKAARAAKEIGAPGLTPMQATDFPLLRLVGRQALAILPRLGRYFVGQEEAMKRAMRAQVDRVARSRLIENATKAVDQSSADIVEYMRLALKHPTESPVKRAMALKRNFNDWWTRSKVDVDNLYITARSIEEPKFNIKNLQHRAKMEKQGVSAKGKQRVDAEDTGILDAMGEPILRTETKQDTVQITTIEQRLSSILSKIDKMDPNLQPLEVVVGETKRTITATDQLREIRKELRDLTLPGPEGLREPNFRAMRILNEVDSILKNPANTNAEFRSAWAKAQGAASKRFSAREAIKVVELANTEQPTRFFSSLIKPNNVDNLITLHRTLGKEGFEVVREGFRGELLRNPKQIGKVLDEFDDETLRILLRPGERKAMRKAASAFAKLDQTGIQQAAQRQTRLSGFVKSVFDTRDTASISALQELVKRSGGKDGPFGKSARAAIMEEIYQRSLVERKGMTVIGNQAMNAVIADFKERGLLRFLKGEDIHLLRNVKAMKRLFDATSLDVGTSIVAGAEAAQARKGNLTNVASTLMQLFGVGRIMTSPTWTRFLTGSGERAVLPMNLFATFGAALGSLGSAVTQERPRDWQAFESLEERRAASGRQQ